MLCFSSLKMPRRSKTRPRFYLGIKLLTRCPDSDVATVLKEGLERTLSQARHLVGTIEKDEDGHHSFVKRKDSTVKFVVQYLDSSYGNFPSFTEIAEAHFVSTKLGDIKLLSNASMIYGEKPEAHPDRSPAIASYKANFIPGGLIFNMHSHHYSNDVVGWGSFTKQLAENCNAIINKTEFPSFDSKCLDRSRLTSPIIPEESRVDAPPQADRHPQHKLSQSLLFHLPKSRAAELKKAASPADGSWISTYDAVSAIMWRVFSRIREPIYKPDPASRPVWAEGVTMIKRLTNPTMPTRMQGNLFIATMSTMSAIPQLTEAEIVSDDTPLSKLASYTRQMTNGVTGDLLAGALQMLAPVRNKTDLSVRVNSFPPMTLIITDWRDADVCTADFGFAKPTAFRHLFDTVTEGLAIVYPPHDGPAGEDEGIELQVVFEKELVDQLVNDPEWKKYFEFRGVDAEEANSEAAAVPASADL